MAVYEGSSSITAAASVTAAAGTIYQAASVIDASASTTAVAGVIYQGAVIIAASASVTANAGNKTGAVSISSTASVTVKSLKAVKTGMANAKTQFLSMKGKLYILDGTNYVEFDGTTFRDVTSIAYIPTVVTGRTPTGGGTTYEQYNRLQAGFKNSFSGTGSATVYYLTQANLDATTVTITVAGATKVEGTDFTVDRVLGTVTFTVAPIAGTDNIIVTAYRTDAAAKAVILACKYAITFGGDNDSRVFLAGDSTTYYYSGLLDPTYFPENNYNNAGVDNTYISGFGKQYNVLVVFKERSMYAVTYSFDGTTVRFPMALLNDSVGCDMPYTIQLINDRLTWCNTYGGVHTLVSTLIKDEKNVRPLSENINGTLQNPGLLNETKTDLQNASSSDFFGHYWICVGSKAWVWNYEISPFVDTGDIYKDQRRLSWFPFTNINANCFIGLDGELYRGDRTNGKVVHFKNNYSDFGTAINAYWLSKLLDFNRFDWTKVILELRYRTRSDTYTKVTTEYFDDQGSRIDPQVDVVSSFSWRNLRWDTLVWRVIKYARTMTKRPKIKNTVHFAVKFSNNINAHNLSILDLAILWMLYRKTK